MGWGWGYDTVAGGNGTDIISGDDGNDTLSGGNSNDLLTGGEGDKSIDGGNGTDIAVYLRQLASYQFIRLGDGAIQVADVDSGETDTARNVELFVFTDAIRAVDDLPFAATLTANDQGGVDIDLSNAAALSKSLVRPASTT